MDEQQIRDTSTRTLQKRYRSIGGTIEQLENERGMVYSELDHRAEQPEYGFSRWELYHLDADIDDAPEDVTEYVEAGDVFVFYKDTNDEQRWVITDVGDRMMEAIALECDARHVSKGTEDRWTRSSFSAAFNAGDIEEVEQ